ncbi:MAG: MBL fold metallo-hydrolase [Verrucomicrobia bacterium]|nr:MBL fold metallo-hydrolase [Verrucomicrobiota bacterium]
MPRNISVITFDVAHGNCHLVTTPGAKKVMIDLGRSDDFSPLEWLKSKGCKRLDLLIVTHPHDDHIRGVFDLAGTEVGILHRPKNVPPELTEQLDPPLQRAWQQFDARFTSPVQPEDKFYDPQSPAFDGMALHFFGGRSDTQNLNNYSIVTVLQFGAFKMVFPGDLETAGWNALLNKPDFVKAITGTTMLVAAHHGREKGWCAELFDHISPQLVIISDGAAKETNYASNYSQKAKGCPVKARNSSEVKTRFVVCRVVFKRREI